MLRERFVAIDRDGVINEDSDGYIKRPSEWIPIPGSIEGITRLTQAGFRIAIVTNQSGLARGLFDLAALNAIHHRLRDRLASAGGRVEMILFCPHGPRENCPCRKPKSGLLLQLAERANVDLVGLPFVGDSITDVAAAKRAGMEPILVRTGKGEQSLADHSAMLKGVRVFGNLKDVVDSLIACGRYA